MDFEELQALLRKSTPRHEPDAETRDAFRGLFEFYQGLQDAGFAKEEALMLIGILMHRNDRGE